jgi:hypothetical protein
MPYEAYMRLLLKSAIIPGPYTFADKEGLFKVHTYNQSIGGWLNPEPFRKRWWLCEHGPIEVSMEFNKLICVCLLKYDPRPPYTFNRIQNFPSHSPARPFLPHPPPWRAPRYYRRPVV